MHQTGARSLEPWRHDHSFGLHKKRSAEHRTRQVVVITTVTMAVEIMAGLAFGSMALLADGLHMGSHALALSISAFAYLWMRRKAGHPSYVLGTGKIASLSGYTGALLLLVPAIGMAWESVNRLYAPRAIDFEWAIVVATLGLIVNVGCALILQSGGGETHSHDHDHHHGASKKNEHHEDHNLRSAYLHVIADALTSVLAIIALGAGAYWGQVWLDPIMGIAGAGLIAIWSWGLIRDSSKVLLDRSVHPDIREGVRAAIEGAADNSLADFHVWSIGPGIYAAALAVVTHEPKAPDHYKSLIPSNLGIKHITVEIHSCED
ncbi:MAG: cation diffusion facilitator family transporter [Alphaproteobacteria bacterium]|jgi:cation diffusion facilitator family transporter